MTILVTLCISSLCFLLLLICNKNKFWVSFYLNQINSVPTNEITWKLRSHYQRFYNFQTFPHLHGNRQWWRGTDKIHLYDTNSKYSVSTNIRLSTRLSTLHAFIDVQQTCQEKLIPPPFTDATETRLQRYLKLQHKPQAADRSPHCWVRREFRWRLVWHQVQLVVSD